MGHRTATLSLVGVLLCFVGCGDTKCSRDAECPAGRVCRAGLCSLNADLDEPDVEVVYADGVMLYGDVVLACRPAELGDLIMTEILADPAMVDVNGDGTYDSADDEFIELVNMADEAVGLLNVKLEISGDTTVAFEHFPAGRVCVEPGSAHVHFGADKYLGLNNGGEAISLLIDNQIADSHEYGEEGAKDVSLTRRFQLDFDSDWIRHHEYSSLDLPWSPGTCPRGDAFPDCEPGGDVDIDAMVGVDVPDGGAVVDPPEVLAPCGEKVPVVGDLIIHEVLADPAGINDANQDTHLLDPKEDEFVEILNRSSTPVALDGITLWVWSEDPDKQFSTDEGGQFTFPVGTCLGAGQAVVVFDTYNGAGEFGGAIPFAHKGLGLNNNEDSVMLLRYDAEGDSVLEYDAVTYGTNAAKDQSLTRPEYASGPPFAEMVLHSMVDGAGAACPPWDGPHERCWASMTPGRCNSGAAFPDCTVEVGPDAGVGPDADVGPDDTAEVDGADGVGPNADGEQADATPACGPSPVAGQLLINEIMSAPDGVDHNGDGATDSEQDEYIEIVNVSGVPLDVSQVQIVTGGGDLGAEVQQLLPVDGCLEVNHGLLVFGGGAPALDIEGVEVLTVGTLSLNDDGDSVALVGQGDVLLDSYTYTELSGESWVRYPDGSGEWMTHGAAATAEQVDPPPKFSPGKCVDGSPLQFCL